MTEAHIPKKAVLLLMFLSLLWGGNMVAIKLSVQGLAPVFSAAVRSVVASACVYAWMRSRGIAAFPDRSTLWHGAAVGVLFGLEFGCIYLGLRHTLASRSAVLLYMHPFFVALGAHFFLRGDVLHARKAGGLALAFGGIVLLFVRQWGAVTLQTLPGDALILAAAFFWAATTLYIKRFLPGRALPVQTLFYQLFFSIPLLFLWSALLEKRVFYGLTPGVAASLAYQTFIVASASYLAWFELIHKYSVSLLSAFTFFTPVFGVLLSAALLPGDGLHPTVLASLTLVCLGTILVNRPQAGTAVSLRNG
ncbi:MAG: DMT family transporter [Deltaproteobacteria bacterium]|nr:DMT family transporter [Deltaproteobacteria bacterium]